jgi:hypothetical protein
LAKEQNRLRNISKRQNKTLKKQLQKRAKLFNKYSRTEFTEYYK